MNKDESIQRQIALEQQLHAEAGDLFRRRLVEQRTAAYDPAATLLNETAQAFAAQLSAGHAAVIADVSLHLLPWAQLFLRLPPDVWSGIVLDVVLSGNLYQGVQIGTAAHQVVNRAVTYLTTAAFHARVKESARQARVARKAGLTADDLNWTKHLSPRALAAVIRRETADDRLTFERVPPRVRAKLGADLIGLLEPPTLQIVRHRGQPSLLKFSEEAKALFARRHDCLPSGSSFFYRCCANHEIGNHGLLLNTLRAGDQ